MRHRVWAIAMVLLGCTPDFAVVECFDDGECSAATRCVERRCLPTLRVDLGARLLDMADVDADPEDRGAPDQGGHDTDALPADMGAVDPPAVLIGRWSFSPGSERVDTTGHWDPLELFGVARIQDGALFVDGYRGVTRGFARASSWGAGDIIEKTVVAWVAVRGLDTFDGAVASMMDRTGAFDALSWGQQGVRGWGAYSDFFRTPNARLVARQVDVEVTHQVALSWGREGQGTRLIICMDGVEVGRTVNGEAPRAWGNATTDLIFGTAQLTPSNRGAWVVEGQRVADLGGLDARIDEVQVFRGVLACAEVDKLRAVDDSPPQPPPPPSPALIGQWSFTPGAEAVDTMGNWDPLQLFGEVAAANGRLIGGFGTERGFARAVGWRGGLIREKTFVAWVSLTDLETHGGAALALDDRTPREPKADALAYYQTHDASVWTHVDEGRAGSRFALVGDAGEPGVMRQVAMSWAADGDIGARVTLCLDGERVGSTVISPMADWRDEAEVLMGVQYLTWQAAGRWNIDETPQLAFGHLNAEIDEVRLYRGALSCDQVRVLEPAP